MSKLFLTSYLAGTKNLVKEFLKDILEKEITFVPTASNTEDYKGYVDEAKQAFLKLGFSINILDISKTEKQKIENILKDTKILYVSGGNTFYLLQELKHKKILDTIKDKISNGMFYIGESAGAIITSKNIEYNQIMDIMDNKEIAPDLDNYEAMNITDFYILPHNNEFPFVESTKETIKIYENKLNLLPISNSEAVFVNGKNLVVKNDDK